MRVGDELLKSFFEGGQNIRRKSWPVGDYICADGAEGGTIWYYDAEEDELTAGYKLGFHDLGTDEWEVV
jgi:hypothetical protein